MLRGTPAPDNPGNRFPPTLHVCELVLGVPSSSKYEVHLCSNGRFMRFEALERTDSPAEHLASCNGCALCRCCQCDAARYELVQGRLRPASVVYLLADVFEQFFLDAEWYAKVAPARAAKAAAWYASPDGKACTAKLLELGYDLSQVRLARCCVRIYLSA